MSITCPYCSSPSNTSDSRELIVSNGSFLRKCDGVTLKRFLCRSCERSFSEATRSPCFGQKKRHLNPIVFKLLASGVSQRRCSFLVGVNRKTTVRKFIFLGLMADQVLKEDLHHHPPATDVQFDDLETFEHSKLKPLSVIAMIESETRRILDFRVARMPAKGLLVKRSLKKYGKRVDERSKVRRDLFKSLAPFIAENAVIKSDSSPHYPEDVKRYFPQAVHVTYKGRRGCVVGQGELKAGGYDPLFSLNHSYAMFRANMSRLFRRTWNTTKRPERLALHLSLYALFHNGYLIHNPSR